jgi:hypothetical protein
VLAVLAALAALGTASCDASAPKVPKVLPKVLPNVLFWTDVDATDVLMHVNHITADRHSERQ